MPKLLDIVLYPNNILRQKATKVEEITEEIKDLVQNMFHTMYTDNGIGLAAPQVGISKRIFVMDAAKSTEDEDTQTVKSDPICFINPEITKKSDEIFEYEEGCLSIPAASGAVKRPKKITVTFTDVEGKQNTIEAEDLMATCIQHEIDHLDGILFIDHLSQIKRDIAIRKYRRFLKSQQENNKN